MWVKIAEIPIAIIAAIGFLTGNLWITLLALIALTCQSSFFGPAKYGMIPELVDGLRSESRQRHDQHDDQRGGDRGHVAGRHCQ